MKTPRSSISSSKGSALLEMTVGIIARQSRPVINAGTNTAHGPSGNSKKSLWHFSG
jgi:hypothetical protein